MPTQDRLAAVLLRGLAWLGMVITLAGCAQGGQLTPMGETLFGHRRTADVRAQAEALPYASLVARKESNRALLIMAHRTGGHGQDTFWQAGDRTTLHLRDGMPASTSGFDAVLLGRWHSSSEGQARYRVHAHWQDRDGQEWQDEALATVTCEPPAPVDMPLTRLTLERCLERLEWIGSNTTTRGKFWREPGTPWIWGGDMTLWPQGPRLQWQVARPWWSDAEETISDAGRTMPPDVDSLP